MHSYTPVLWALWCSFWSFRSEDFPLIMPCLIQNLIKLTHSHIFLLMDQTCRWNNSLEVFCWTRERPNPQFKKNRNFFWFGCDTNWLLWECIMFSQCCSTAKNVNQKIMFLLLKFLFFFLMLNSGKIHVT